MGAARAVARTRAMIRIFDILRNGRDEMMMARDMGANRAIVRVEVGNRERESGKRRAGMRHKKKGEASNYNTM